jgi:acetyl esterase/lipase
MKLTLLLLLIVISAFIARSQDPGLILHQPAMDKVTVEEGKKFMTSNDTTLVFDAYYPPGFDKKQQLPVVVFVNGVGSIDLYRWKIYRDWARLVAANGLIAVNYQTRGNHAMDDSERVLDYLGTHARELSIDKERIGLWSCSGNVGTGLPLAMKESRDNVKALVVYYGSAQLQSTPLRQDLELQIVRAGLDFYNLNVGIESFVKRALTEDLHFEYINYPEGQHAFDAFDDTPRSREIILQTVDFLKRVLSKDHPAPAKTVITNSRLWNMIVAEKKVDEALKERKTAVDMYSKMPNHSPWFNHLIDERNLNQMGYQLLEAGRTSDALKVFMANQEDFPQSANVYDAIADAYEKAGDKQNAVLNAKKALEKLAIQTDLRPELRDGIKRSAEEKLQRLQ